MSLQTFLSILAAICGCGSGIWFCLGPLQLDAEKIKKIADDSWDADPGTCEALIAQSAEYL